MSLHLIFFKYNKAKGAFISLKSTTVVDILGSDW
jgi:hypothetical protein